MLKAIKKTTKPIKFVKKGTSQKTRGPVDRSSSVIDKAKDWELLIDFDDNRILFPPEIYSTAQRPDIVILSRSIQCVIIAELTCGAEEGFVNAKLRKKGRYTKLVSAINDDGDNPWSALLFTIEVGARGFVGYSLISFLRNIGRPSRQIRSTCKRISLISAKCSFGIYLMRANEHWDAKRPLLELPAKKESDLGLPPQAVSATTVCSTTFKVAQKENRRVSLQTVVERSDKERSANSEHTPDSILEARFLALSPDPPVVPPKWRDANSIKGLVYDDFGLPILPSFVMPPLASPQTLPFPENEELRKLHIMFSVL